MAVGDAIVMLFQGTLTASQLQQWGWRIPFLLAIVTGTLVGFRVQGCSQAHTHVCVATPLALALPSSHPCQHTPCPPLLLPPPYLHSPPSPHQSLMLRLSMPEPDELLASRAAALTGDDAGGPPTIITASSPAAGPPTFVTASPPTAAAASGISAGGIEGALVRMRLPSAVMPVSLRPVIKRVPLLHLLVHHWHILFLQVTHGVVFERGCLFATPCCFLAAAHAQLPSVRWLEHFAPPPLTTTYLVQILFEFWFAVAFYAYTAWLPSYFRSVGVATLTTQVGGGGRCR